MNCVWRTDRAVRAQDVYDRVRAFFAARRRGFVFMLHTSRDADLETFLQSAGLKYIHTRRTVHEHRRAGGAADAAGRRSH